MRCSWAVNDLAIAYHDREWGVPVHDDRTLFEYITLEGAQAGLSWDTVLRKRDRYREVFSDFDPVKVARFTTVHIEKLLLDPGVIRHRGKLESTVSNAAVVLAIAKERGSFDAFVWDFVGGKSQTLPRAALPEGTEFTPEAEALSKALRKRGMRFVGPTIVYAFMQACGMVNDHAVECERHAAVSAL